MDSPCEVCAPVGNIYFNTTLPHWKKLSCLVVAHAGGPEPGLPGEGAVAVLCSASGRGQGWGLVCAPWVLGGCVCASGGKGKEGAGRPAAELSRSHFVNAGPLQRGLCELCLLGSSTK